MRSSMLTGRLSARARCLPPEPSRGSAGAAVPMDGGESFSYGTRGFSTMVDGLVGGMTELSSGAAALSVGADGSSVRTRQRSRRARRREGILPWARRGGRNFSVLHGDPPPAICPKSRQIAGDADRVRSLRSEEGMKNATSLPGSPPRSRSSLPHGAPTRAAAPERERPPAPAAAGPPT